MANNYPSQFVIFLLLYSKYSSDPIFFNQVVPLAIFLSFFQFQFSRLDSSSNQCGIPYSNTGWSPIGGFSSIPSNSPQSATSWSSQFPIWYTYHKNSIYHLSNYIYNDTKSQSLQCDFIELSSIGLFHSITCSVMVTFQFTFNHSIGSQSPQHT